MNLKALADAVLRRDAPRDNARDTAQKIVPRPGLEAGHSGTPATLAEAGELAAVKLTRTMIGDLWLVADAQALAEHPDIIRSGLPVFWFDEVERLRGKTPAELKAIGVVKATFPTSRVLQ